MVFGNPMLLWGLLALCIPIIIHLVRLRRLKTVEFSSFKFLKKTAEQGAKPRQWHRLLLMSLRVLGLLGVVLGLAMPACNSRDLQKNKLLVGVVFDNSLSMAGTLENSVVFDARKQLVLEYINQLPSYAEVKLVSHSGFGGVSNGLSKEDAMQWIANEQVVANADKLSTLCTRLLVSMQKESGIEKEVHVFSDFQATESLPNANINSENTAVTFVDFDLLAKTNVAIDSAWMDNAFVLNGEKSELYFKIINMGSSAISNFPVKLYNNGVQLALSSVNCDKNSSVIGKFELFLPEIRSNMWLEIEDKSFEFDNKKFVYIAPLPKIKVKELGAANEYVNKVLATQDIFTKSEQARVILATEASESQLRTVLAQVEQGATALISVHTASAYIAQLVGVKDWQLQTQKLGISANSLNHPYFKRVFKKTPDNMDMPQVFEYYKSTSGLGIMQPIITLDNGDVFFAQVNKGKGKLYLCLAPLLSKNSNWVSSSLFLPTITQALLPSEHLGDLYGELAQNKPVILNQRLPAEQENVWLQKDTQKFIAGVTNTAQGTQLYFGNEIQKPGTYNVLPSQGSAAIDVLALNINSAESTNAKWTKKDLAAFLGNVNWKTVSENNSINITRLSRAAQSNSMWRLFIWAATLFFVAEMLLIWFNNKKLTSAIK